VGCLVVVDDVGRFRGMLTERHLVGGLVAEQVCAVDRCTAAASWIRAWCPSHRKPTWVKRWRP
jgi:hypothetical protein